jgi:predicted cupin superfamily sugar epimerase
MATPPSINSRSANDIIQKLNLTPHPEKGYFKETYRDTATDSTNRSFSTQIYYLLEGREKASNWHRVDATETWHYYAGAPLKLQLATPTKDSASDADSKYNFKEHTLGQDIFANQDPQVVIDPHVWQRATSLGEWTLVGCTVAPAFMPEGFDMAPPGWEPEN